ncbi:MAG: hypothetical protein GF393_12435 [Armatimonadia bacterium]|nr:hypothetical protein [Armatimonadia bacterium]
MRKSDADVQTTEEREERTEEASECTISEEIERAADRAIERNREALTELADW